MQTKKSTKKQSSPSLVEIAENAVGYVPRTWLDDLTPEQKSDVTEIATRMANGTFQASLSVVAGAWQEAGIKCSKGKLQQLVSKIRKGAKP